MSIKNSASDKNELIYAIAWLVAAVAFGLFLIIPVRQIKKATKDYDDYISVTYTFQSSEFHNVRKNQHYTINVEEEEKPLLIAEIYLSALNKDNLASLYSGDKVQCYVEPSGNDDYSYDLVEMYKGGMAIIIMKDRNSNGLNNATIGLILIPVMTIMLLSMSIYHFVKYFKQRRQTAT